MNKIYLAMADYETVDRAFSTQQKAIDYVRGWLSQNPYYQQNPNEVTDELILRHYINECLFD